MSDLIVLDGVRYGYDGEWPPPYHVEIAGQICRRVSHSKLPDDYDRTNLIRGALYEVVEQEVEED